MEPIELQLEDVRGLPQGVSLENMAYVSIAISLKRIADELEAVRRRCATDDIGPV